MYNNSCQSAKWIDTDEVHNYMAKAILHPKKLIVTVRLCKTGVIKPSFLKSGEICNAKKYCTWLGTYN